MALSDRDKKTIRIGAVAVAVYLVCFYGWSLWDRTQVRHKEYLRLLEDSRRLEMEIKPYEARATKAGKLMDDFNLNPEKLSRETLVAQASAAIQKAAMTGGVGLGPIRETPGRGSSREIATMQIQGNGPIQAIMGLLYHLERVGFPLIIDSVQITSDPMRPGPVKLNLTLIILDYSQWKTAKAPMRERIQPILRLVCLALAAFLVYQVTQSAFRGDPLGHLSIPPLPKLSSDTNSPPAKPDGQATNAPAIAGTNKPGTNDSGMVAHDAASPAGMPAFPGTNAPGVAAHEGTNTPAAASVAKDTNAVADAKLASSVSTNAASARAGVSKTNHSVAASAPGAGTNAPAATAAEKKDTNAVAAKPAAEVSTNAITALNGDSKTNNSTAAGKITGTNSPTNVVVAAAGGPGPRARRGGGPGGLPPGMAGMPGMPMMGGGGPPLPDAVRARVDRIVDSEILGMVMHPVPMALLGIAGNSAFLRAPNGQTGLVKPGDELGGVKIIRIGINRVLVEEAGESKELTLFSGFGGDTLLPTPKANLNEPNH